MTGRGGFSPALAVVVALAAGLRLLWLDRLPPGLHYDEAAFGVLALDLLRAPRVQVFFGDFTGLEPTFIYLSALSTGLLGPSALALRLVGALIGIGAVAATGLAGRALFGERVGLIGAALLAVSFWHLVVSRMAYGAGLMALVPPVGIWLLWRAWRRSSLLRVIAAGVAGGAIAYTYVGARLLLLVVPAFLALDLLVGRSRGARARLAAGWIAAAAATVAPLALYFARHPGDFTIRFRQTIAIGDGASLLEVLATSLPATLATYGVRGDALQKYNLPYQPAIDGALTFLLLIGLGYAVARIGRPESRLCLLWLIGSLAASFITLGSPNHLRLIGAAPPTYLLVALGFVAITDAVGRWRHVDQAGLAGRWPGADQAGLARGRSGTDQPGVDRADRAGRWQVEVAPPRRPATVGHGLVGATLARVASWRLVDSNRSPTAAPGRSTRLASWRSVAALALIAVEAAVGVDAYFRRWAPSEATYAAVEGDIADAARLARSVHPLGRLYISSEHFRHPTVAYLAGPAYRELTWFDGRHASVFPPPGEAATYILPRSARPRDSASLGRPVAARPAPDRAPGAEAVERSAEMAPPTGRLAVGATFIDPTDGPLAELVAVDPVAATRAGEVAAIRTVWRLRADAVERGLDFFAHAIDERGRRWGQADLSPYLGVEWRRDETVVVWLEPRLDATAPAGRYRLRVGLNAPGAPAPLGIARADGVALPEVLTEPFAVSHAGETSVDRAVAELRRAAGPGVALYAGPAEGSDVGDGSVGLLAATLPTRLAAGQSATIDLLWQARRDRPTGRAELLLRDDAGRERGLGARELAELDPAAPWLAGEIQRDVRPIEARRDGAGRWQAIVRLGHHEAVLGEIEIVAPPIDRAPPSPARRLDAAFGEVARLVGLDLAPGTVRLDWQATADGERGYAVFVHALDASGRILAQHDGVPAGGTRPTSGWAAGEYVRDDHPLVLPPGTTSLAIGLYDPTTGQRLSLRSGGDRLVVPIQSR